MCLRKISREEFFKPSLAFFFKLSAVCGDRNALYLPQNSASDNLERFMVFH